MRLNHNQINDKIPKSKTIFHSSHTESLTPIQPKTTNCRNRTLPYITWPIWMLIAHCCVSLGSETESRMSEIENTSTTTSFRDVGKTALFPSSGRGSSCILWFKNHNKSIFKSTLITPYRPWNHILVFLRRRPLHATTTTTLTSAKQ